jgi:hypothetical protein
MQASSLVASTQWFRSLMMTMSSQFLSGSNNAYSRGYIYGWSRVSSSNYSCQRVGPICSSFTQLRQPIPSLVSSLFNLTTGCIPQADVEGLQYTPALSQCSIPSECNGSWESVTCERFCKHDLLLWNVFWLCLL